MTTTVAPVPTIPSHAARLDQLPGSGGGRPGGGGGRGDGISGPVVPAGIDATTGELALPAEAKVVAWYQYGPAPGANGSAVLAGHVDWHGVPGIFFELRDLKAGDTVAVTMSDGSTQSWTVVDVHLVAKPELPVADVFARTGPPTLTLITCGGSFDYSHAPLPVERRRHGRARLTPATAFLPVALIVSEFGTIPDTASGNRPGRARLTEPHLPLLAPSAPGRSGHARAYRRSL